MKKQKEMFFGLEGIHLLALLFGWIGLVITLLVHLLTFFEVAPSHKWPILWMLHWGGLVVFVVILIQLWRTSRNNSSKNTSKRIKRAAPLWMYGIVGIFILHAIVTFGSLYILNEGGITGRIGYERYALINHGEIIRELTEREFYKHKTYEERLLSGSLLIFYVGVITGLLSYRTRSD